MSAYEAVLQKLKRNRITAGILVLGVAVIAIGQVTGALKDIWEVLAGVMPDSPAYILDDDAFRRGEAEYAVGHNAPAAEAFRQSAKAGNPLAGAALAWMYGEGRGVPADREWARYWAEQALVVWIRQMNLRGLIAETTRIIRLVVRGTPNGGYLPFGSNH